jgi:hypothetical protein
MAWLNDETDGWYKPPPPNNSNQTPNYDVPDPFSKAQQQYIPNNLPSPQDTTPAVDTAPASGGGATAPDWFAPLNPVADAPAPVGRWVVPDYESMLPGAWELTNAGAEGNRMTGQAEADFQKAFRQAFIDYGGDSGNAGDYSKYLDAPTIEAAKNNKFSRLALNLQAMQKAQRRARALLAARGLTSSGANTGAMRDILSQREQADWGDLRSFLGQADTGYAGIAGVRERVAELMRQARRDAAARLAAENPGSWQY